MSRRALLADLALPIVIVLLLAGGVFAVTGAWPPVVAVESGSMEPHTSTGDLVVVTGPERYDGPTPGLVGAADVEQGEYERLGGPGDVIVFDVPGTDGPPILHRVAFHVEEGENWYDRADPSFHEAESCQALRHCPAPYDGYITYGDANGVYDQTNGIAPPVRDEWVVAKAQVRVPKLGWVRIVMGEFLGDGSIVSDTSSQVGAKTVSETAAPASSEPVSGPDRTTIPARPTTIDRSYGISLTAGIADRSAGTADRTAGTADRTAGTADRTAGTADRTVGTADRTVGTADRTVGTADRSPGTPTPTCLSYTSPSSVMESVAALRNASDLPNSPGEIATVRIP